MQHDHFQSDTDNMFKVANLYHCTQRVV